MSEMDSKKIKECIRKLSETSVRRTRIIDIPICRGRVLTTSPLKSFPSEYGIRYPPLSILDMEAFPKCCNMGVI